MGWETSSVVPARNFDYSVCPKIRNVSRTSSVIYFRKPHTLQWICHAACGTWFQCISILFRNANASAYKEFTPWTLIILVSVSACTFVHMVGCIGVLRPFDMLGNFGRSQLTWPHCSWANLLGSLPVLVPILWPVTDNCPSWNSERERMVVEIFSWPNLNERIFCWTWGSNLWPPAYQADARPIKLPRTAIIHMA